MNNILKVTSTVSCVVMVLSILLAAGSDGPLEPSIWSKVLVVMLVSSMLGTVVPLILIKKKED